MNGDLRQQTMTFGAALRDQEPIARLVQAQDALAADVEATRLLEEFQRAQADLRLKQMSGELTQEEIRNFRFLRASLGKAAPIAALVQAQRGATEFLQEVNAKLSELLGLDFASLARPASGCC